MSLDNTLYDRLAHSWWDPAGCLHLLAPVLNQVRLAYLREVLIDRVKLDPRHVRAIDLGCGGGLFSEEICALGPTVVGLDPSLPSLAAADRHRRAHQLRHAYCQGAGERLPFGDRVFDLIVCCDVLEHVDNVQMVLDEAHRVLTPGGIFFFDTINRTLSSYLLVIVILQQWRLTRAMPPRLHEWTRFIKPAELRDRMKLAGLVLQDVTGLAPAAPLRSVLSALRRRNRGGIGYAELGERLKLGRSPSTRIMYMGYAVAESVGGDRRR